MIHQSVTCKQDLKYHLLDKHRSIWNCMSWTPDKQHFLRQSRYRTQMVTKMQHCQACVPAIQSQNNFGTSVPRTSLQDLYTPEHGGHHISCTRLNPVGPRPERTRFWKLASHIASIQHSSRWNLGSDSDQCTLYAACFITHSQWHTWHYNRWSHTHWLTIFASYVSMSVTTITSGIPMMDRKIMVYHHAPLDVRSMENIYWQFCVCSWSSEGVLT